MVHGVVTIPPLWLVNWHVTAMWWGFSRPASRTSAESITNLHGYGPEMASVCTGGSVSSDEDELGVDSLERLVDERLAAITNK